MQHLDRVQQENSALYEKIVSFQIWIIWKKTFKIQYKQKANKSSYFHHIERKGSIQNSPRHSSLLNEMECDEDQGISDRFNSPEAIMKEARSVYNQLKMLHFTLKGNQDGDSGKFFHHSFFRPP